MALANPFIPGGCLAGTDAFTYRIGDGNGGETIGEIRVYHW